MSAHTVFVRNLEGNSITPTTPARARHLLRGAKAERVWSKFGTFGIRMLVATRNATPVTSLGVDHGTKFEGYSVVCGDQNSLNVKLDLPDKKQFVRRMDERRALRKARRHRNCRRRLARFNNRKRDGFVAPSQLVIVQSRLKILRAFFAIYPITLVGLEDSRFNHAKNKWGANFSTMEIGKTRIKSFLAEAGATVTEYRGFETQEMRKQYGYKKTSSKSADRFESHCSDALTLACAVNLGRPVDPGPFLVVDDTYRPVRRRLHDTQPAKGGVRQAYSRGTVFGMRKGRLVCGGTGKIGQLCGTHKGRYRYTYLLGIRQDAKTLRRVSSQFRVKRQDTKRQYAEGQLDTIC